MADNYATSDIVKALKLCAVSDGDVCCYCPYSKIVGGECSKQLMKDASKRLGFYLNRGDDHD